MFHCSSCYCVRVRGIVSAVCCIVHRATDVTLNEGCDIARSVNRVQVKLQLIPLRVFLLHRRVTLQHLTLVYTPGWRKRHCEIKVSFPRP